LLALLATCSKENIRLGYAYGSSHKDGYTISHCSEHLHCWTREHIARDVIQW